MNKIVEELKQLISFKDTTVPGDVVLIAAKNPQMFVYAYVNEIQRDTSRRDEWWHVHFTMLSIPMQEITWTLRTPQMTGQEVFTMGGEERFVKAVVMGAKGLEPLGTGESEKNTPAKAKVSPLKRVK